MSPDSIPQLSLGTAALIIFAVCGAFVAVRGMTRMIVGTLVFGTSVWIGFRVWQSAPTLSIDWTGKSLPWITTGLPALSFLIAFFLLRRIAKIIARPFGPPATEAKPRTIVGMAFRLLLALIPTSIFWIIGATLIHHGGSIAEVRAYSEKIGGQPVSTPTGFSQSLKSAVEAALPESWLHSLDPLTEPSRINLAKLIASRSEAPLKPVINPQTGKPFPRAIIVDDPELQNLAREGNFGTLLRHPLLTKALADPALRKILHDLSL